MKNLRILFALVLCTTLFNACTAESILDEQEPTVIIIDDIDLDDTGGEEAEEDNEEEQPE